MTDDPRDRARRSALAMYADDVASQSLGIVIEEIGPGRATARMRVADRMINGHAVAHGGYIFLLADTAFAVACNTHGPSVAGAAEVVFVRPVKAGEELIAQATERVSFGRNGVYDVTVRDVDGDVVAEFRGHSRRLAKPVE